MLRGHPTAVALSAVLGLAAAAACVGSCTLTDRKQSVVPDLVAHKVASAHAVGSDACGKCHEKQPKFYQSGYHRIAFFEKGTAMGCESCHGPGSEHVKREEADDDEGGKATIVNRSELEAMSASDRSAVCLQCHQVDFPLWPTTDHSLHGVSCWDCHASDLHKVTPDVATYKPAALKAKRDDAFCLQCHDSVRADFRLQYHHPVIEGQMRCADCHSIHGEPRKNPVIQETNAECLSCHRDVGGPWVFEHLAMDEGCQTCHQPHGAINNKLLITVDNSLCIKCHFQQPVGFFGKQPHANFLQGGALCYDCHFQVHGSNTDRNLNPRRF